MIICFRNNPRCRNLILSLFCCFLYKKSNRYVNTAKVLESTRDRESSEQANMWSSSSYEARRRSSDVTCEQASCCLHMIDLQMSLGCLRSPEREDKREGREIRSGDFRFLSVLTSSGEWGGFSFRFGREHRIKRVICLSVFIYFKGI